MSGSIQVRNGEKPIEWVRPEWTYVRPSNGNGAGLEHSQLEMMESIRNVLEDY